MLTQYFNTQNHSAALVIECAGHHTGFPRNYVGVFRLRQVLVLFHRWSVIIGEDYELVRLG